MSGPKVPCTCDCKCKCWNDLRIDLRAGFGYSLACRELAETGKLRKGWKVIEPIGGDLDFNI